MKIECPDPYRTHLDTKEADQRRLLQSRLKNRTANIEPNDIGAPYLTEEPAQGENMSDTGKPGTCDWPTGLSFSMAPFGYVVHVRRTELTQNSVTYKCCQCKFQASFDPTDMNVRQAQQLFRWHVDQSH